MNELNQENLYNLLPTIYRQRDIALGEPLRAFFQIIESEYLLVRANIEALYDNWFIETCDDWVVPYIGDLLGVRGLTHDRDFTSTQRSRVGNILGYRRRKGIAAILEHVAQDSTGWKAHVVEFFELLSATQQINHVRPGKGGTADLRDERAMNESGTPFDTLAHTADVRNIPGRPWKSTLESGALRGKYNIGDVGLYLWRLQSYPVMRGTPRKLLGPEEKRQLRRPLYYSFHPLGDDYGQAEVAHTFPLFNQPLTETSITDSSSARDVPEALRREPLRAELEDIRRGATPATDYFSNEPVLRIFTCCGASPPETFVEIHPAEMVVCDLSAWEGLPVFNMPANLQIMLDFQGEVPPDIRREFTGHGIILSPQAALVAIQLGNVWRIDDATGQDGETRKSYLIINERYKLDVYDMSLKVAVDPVLGRLMFPPYAAPADVRVSYSYGYSANIGGGPYARSQTLAVPDSNTWLARVFKNAAETAATADGVLLFDSLHEALASWRESGQNGVIQIADNAIYELGTDAQCDTESGFEEISLAAEQQLVIEAADGICPCITGQLCLKNKGEGGRLTLNGLWFDGRIVINGDLHLDVRHCTLKPRPNEPPPTRTTVSNRIIDSAMPQHGVSLPGLFVTISKSIVGRICLPANALNLTVRDSIVDGGTGAAVSGLDAGGAESVITIPTWQAVGSYGPSSVFERSTIFGKVSVTDISAASDVIFNDTVIVLNRESGTIRFSYVPLLSQTPQLYRCQPWLSLSPLTASLQTQGAIVPRPVFTSEIFGRPGYAQLGLQCPKEIQSGAENGAEMGVFNFLYQPQRVDGLSLTIAEYLPYGHEVGVFYVN
jgi:hypothetical protein